MQVLTFSGTHFLLYRVWTRFLRSRDPLPPPPIYAGVPSAYLERTLTALLRYLTRTARTTMKSWTSKKDREDFTEAYLKSQINMFAKKSQEVTKQTTWTDDANVLETLPQLWCVRRVRNQVSDRKLLIAQSCIFAVNRMCSEMQILVEMRRWQYLRLHGGVSNHVLLLLPVHRLRKNDV